MMMKLSEAIRLGAMLHPQSFGKLFERGTSNSKTIRATCATGAAIDAATGRLIVDGIMAFPRRWHFVSSKPAKCPCGCDLSRPVGWTIVHLNDERRWTRERIANWVERIENSPASNVVENAAAKKYEANASITIYDPEAILS